MSGATAPLMADVGQQVLDVVAAKFEPPSDAVAPPSAPGDYALMPETNSERDEVSHMFVTANAKDEDLPAFEMDDTAQDEALLKGQKQWENTGGGRFGREPRVRDLPWAILFLAHLLVVFILFINGAVQLASPQDVIAESPWHLAHLKQLLPIAFVSLIVAVGIAFLWVEVLRRWARILIVGTLYANIAVLLLTSIGLFALGQTFSAIGSLVLLLFHLLLLRWWTSRIPFATALLTTVAGLLQTYPATFHLALIAMVFQGLWLLLWVLAVCGGLTLAPTSRFWLVLFLVFSFYWTLNVIKNIVHVTVSGTLASWYFLANTPAMPATPVTASLRRAVTTSFGSICLGSLIIAVVKSLRALTRFMKQQNQNSFVAKCLDCLLSFVERWAELFNTYAFTQVAIYGKPFCEASRDTWTLIRHRGYDIIINDSLISKVLLLGSVVGGLSSCLVAGLMASVVSNATPQFISGAMALGFFLGFAVVEIALEVVESAVACLFVCFAEEPNVLRMSLPELFQRLYETYSRVLAAV